MWIVLSFVSCFLSAVAAVYRKSGIKGQNPFWYGAISLTISTITIFIIGKAVEFLYQRQCVDEKILQIHGEEIIALCMDD